MKQMICTSTDGKKAPLAIIGKSKNPTCFNLGKFPIAYKNQNKAYFTLKVTVWWIKTVFWTHHLNIQGYMNAILILDNYSSHKELDGSDVAKKFGLSDRFIIIFLPPNLTSQIQTADMCMLAVLKLGYKVFMVNKLLDAYKDQSFADIDLARKKQKRGCKGL